MWLYHKNTCLAVFADISFSFDLPPILFHQEMSSGLHLDATPLVPPRSPAVPNYETYGAERSK